MEKEADRTVLSIYQNSGCPEGHEITGAKKKKKKKRGRSAKKKKKLRRQDSTAR